MDDLESYLVNDRQLGNKVSPESLELLGKEAANQFLDSGVSLNEAIPKLVGGIPDFNSEHVKRVCEFANTAVYLAKHDQNKTAGANSSYPQFPLADPNRIIQDLSDGARPTRLTPTDVDYGRQPLKTEKISSADATDALADLFGIKTASAAEDFSPETGVEEVMSTKDMLQGLKDNLARTNERLDMMRKEASESYYDSVKRHLLDGGAFEDVVNAAHHTGANSREITDVLQPVVSRLLQEKVATVRQLKDGVSRLEKVAHRVLNEEHGFVRDVREIVSLGREMRKTASALVEADAGLAKVNQTIRERCRGNFSR
jgi:hypothetical protein